MEPAAGDTQNRAQQADRIGGAVGGDEGELRFHAFSAHLAKKAEAFRRISFSSWSRLLSRRSCCNSAASTLRRATASADPAACCSRRQVFTCVAATPRAWATLLSVSPVSSSRATAAALNSAVYRLRVFFVMTFLQMVFEINIWSGLAGQGHERLGQHAAQCCRRPARPPSRRRDPKHTQMAGQAEQAGVVLDITGKQFPND